MPEDKLPKDATPGRTLTGTLSLSKKDGSSEEAPGKLRLSYRLGAAAALSAALKPLMPINTQPIVSTRALPPSSYCCSLFGPCSTAV